MEQQSGENQSGYDAVGSTDGFYSAENFTCSGDCSVGDRESQSMSIIIYSAENILVERPEILQDIFCNFVSWGCLRELCLQDKR